MTADDMVLVCDYARSSSEEAFATIVSRHVNLVYSVALRHVRDPHLAEEVTQVVFIILARKAGALAPNMILSGWLCRTARNVSARAMTSQHRRQTREQEAYMQSLLNEPESVAWTQIAPLLDTGLAQLGRKDHDAVVLRFFERKNFRDVGVALGASEGSAKKRVGRALEKLRRFFTKKGIRLSAAIIAGAVSANAVQAAPIGLARTVTIAAVKGTGVATSTLTLIKTTLKIMTWTKVKTGAVVCVLAIVTAGTATVAIQRAKAPGNADAPNAGSSKFKFAGYATPEDSVQSVIWAASTGDMDKMTATVTSGKMEQFKGAMAGKTDEEIHAGLEAWANGMADYQVTQKEVISDDEVHLHIHATPSAEALRSGKVVLVMRKIGNEWKEDGEVN